MYGVSHFALIGVDIIREGDAFHCEMCDHILLRDSELSGGTGAHETVKINQSQFVYIEGSDIHGADDNAIDFVAVQYGHVSGNRIHDARDWCMYAKGGSAYLTFSGNEVFDCGTGGITAGSTPSSHGCAIPNTATTPSPMRHGPHSRRPSPFQGSSGTPRPCPFPQALTPST